MERRESYPSSQLVGLTDVLERFLAGEVGEVDAACLGLPAPIDANGVFPLTNLPWQIDRNLVVKLLGTERVALINDVEASAAGIPGISSESLICLQEGQMESGANRAIVSIGTGLGVSVLTAPGHAFATESGHATFAPRREPDFALQASLAAKYGHVSWERVASGSGLPDIYQFLAGPSSERLEGPEVFKRSGHDSICARAVELFLGYVGAASGDAALTLMTSGGLYLYGGVAEQLCDEKNARLFLDAFCDKGRMRSLLTRVPIFVVEDENLALQGAARTAMSLLDTAGRLP
jgi:glucokinase